MAVGIYARTAVNLLNTGGVGYTHWTLFDYMRTDERMMKTGMYGFYTDGWKTRPFYHSYSLLSRYCVPGSEVYPGLVEAVNDEYKDLKESGVCGTMLKNAEGQWTQLLTNDNDYTVKIKIKNPQLKNAVMKRYLYSESTLDGDNMILSSGEITCENGEMIVAVPARSFIVLTNMP